MYKDVATKLAWHFVGRPYIWGGDDPMRGFDCSGFVLELLQACNVVPLDLDMTAKDLYIRFENNVVSFQAEGCLVFWGDSVDSIRHVEYCINEDLSIGASGGGSRTKTVQDAIDQNAYIKVRPTRRRAGIIGYVDPFMRR
jgi:cell wall-associated NlpC family hydrolase